MKFRYLTGSTNYTTYKAELESAKDLFNERAEKMKKASTLNYGMHKRSIINNSC